MHIARTMCTNPNFGICLFPHTCCTQHYTYNCKHLELKENYGVLSGKPRHSASLINWCLPILKLCTLITKGWVTCKNAVKKSKIINGFSLSLKVYK